MYSVQILSCEFFFFCTDFRVAINGKERVAWTFEHFMKCQLWGSILTDTAAKFVQLQSQTVFILGWKLPHYNCHLNILILPSTVTGKLVLSTSCQDEQMLEAPCLFSTTNPWFLPLLLVKYSGFPYHLFQVWADQLPQSPPFTASKLTLS